MRATPDALFVTEPLFELMYTRRDVCVFLKTQDLVGARGNNHHPQKLDEMEGELYLNIPRDPLCLPILVLNCEHGHMILMEGNNRHQFFLENNLHWFPVHVCVEVGSVRNMYEEYNGITTAVSMTDSDWFCEPLWMRKDKWRNDIRGVFKHVFNMETLDLDDNE